MVKYYGRARQRVGSVNTNQLGLKMSGCPSKVGRSGRIDRYISRRSHCGIVFCGWVWYHGIKWKQNHWVNPYTKEINWRCIPAAPITRALAGGVGRLNAPRFRCAKNCGQQPWWSWTNHPHSSPRALGEEATPPPPADGAEIGSQWHAQVGIRGFVCWHGLDSSDAPPGLPLTRAPDGALGAASSASPYQPKWRYGRDNYNLFIAQMGVLPSMLEKDGGGAAWGSSWTWPGCTQGASGTYATSASLASGGCTGLTTPWDKQRPWKMMSFGGSAKDGKGLVFGPDDLDIETAGSVGRATWDWIFQSDIVDYYDGITFDIENISTGAGWTMTNKKWARLFKAIRLGTTDEKAVQPVRLWGTKVWQGCMSPTDWTSANTGVQGKCTGGSCAGKESRSTCTACGKCTGGSCSQETTKTGCDACTDGVWTGEGEWTEYRSKNHDCCPCPPTAFPLTGSQFFTFGSTCTLCDPSDSKQCPQCAKCSSADDKDKRAAELTWATNWKCPWMKFGGQGHQGRIQIQLIWWGRYADPSNGSGGGNIPTTTLQDWIWGGDNTPPISGQYIDIITPMLYSSGAGPDGYLWDGVSWLSCHNTDSGAAPCGPLEPAGACTALCQNVPGCNWGNGTGDTGNTAAPTCDPKSGLLPTKRAESCGTICGNTGWTLRENWLQALGQGGVGSAPYPNATAAPYQRARLCPIVASTYENIHKYTQYDLDKYNSRLCFGGDNTNTCTDTSFNVLPWQGTPDDDTTSAAAGWLLTGFLQSAPPTCTLPTPEHPNPPYPSAPAALCRQSTLPWVALADKTKTPQFNLVGQKVTQVTKNGTVAGTITDFPGVTNSKGQFVPANNGGNACPHAHGCVGFIVKPTKPSMEFVVDEPVYFVNALHGASLGKPTGALKVVCSPQSPPSLLFEDSTKAPHWAQTYSPNSKGVTVEDFMHWSMPNIQGYIIWPETPPANTIRCGSGWQDANDNCDRPQCTTPSDCTTFCDNCCWNKLATCP